MLYRCEASINCKSFPNFKLLVPATRMRSAASQPEGFSSWQMSQHSQLYADCSASWLSPKAETLHCTSKSHASE